MNSNFHNVIYEKNSLSQILGTENGILSHKNLHLA